MSGQISALEVQKHNKNRVSVYLDGEFAFGLEAVEAARLAKGQYLSDADIAHLQAQNEVSEAMDRALRFLGHRPRSSAEVRRRLAEYGIRAEVIAQTLTRLQDLNYVNDTEFARYWVQNRTEFSPRGARALRQELREKGIESAIIETVLAELDSDALAYEAAQKKVRSLRGQDARTLQTTLGNFLLRRGFNYEVAKRVTQRIITEATEAAERDHDTE